MCKCVCVCVRMLGVLLQYIYNIALVGIEETSECDTIIGECMGRENCQIQIRNKTNGF